MLGRERAGAATAGTFSNMRRQNPITHLHGDPGGSLRHKARRAAPQATPGKPIRFFTLFVPLPPLRVHLGRPPALDEYPAGTWQWPRRHGNTVKSSSQSALNSAITSAARADVPAVIEHTMSDKMQGSPVTVGMRRNAALLNGLFYTTLI